MLENEASGRRMSRQQRDAVEPCKINVRQGNLCQGKLLERFLVRVLPE